MSSCDNAVVAAHPSPGLPPPIEPHQPADMPSPPPSSPPPGPPQPSPQAASPAVAPAPAGAMPQSTPARAYTPVVSVTAAIPPPQAITVTPHARPAAAAVPLAPQDIVAPQAAVPLSAAVASMHRAAAVDVGGIKRSRPVRRRTSNDNCHICAASCSPRRPDRGASAAPAPWHAAAWHA